MATYLTNSNEITLLADAIRRTFGVSTSISYPTGFENAITELPLVANFQSKTITPSDEAQTITPDSEYNGLSCISVAAIPSTYVGSAYSVISATTYVPTSYDIVISSNVVLSGSHIIKGESKLSSDMIASGVTIFGVTGSLISSYARYVDAIRSLMTQATVYTIYIPSCSYVLSGFFSSVPRVTKVIMPNCKSLYDYAFYSCTTLQSIFFPKCKMIRDSAFYCCWNLKAADLPECEYVGSNAFLSCGSLSDVNLPKCELIGSMAFYSCSRISTLSLPCCEVIHQSAFQRCTALSSLYLTGSSVVSLISSNAFSSTAITPSGAIYVPASLLDSYKTDSIWGYYSSRFQPI